MLGAENDTPEGRASQESPLTSGIPEMEGTSESPPGIPESDILPDDLDAQAEESVAVKFRRDPIADGPHVQGTEAPRTSGFQALSAGCVGPSVGGKVE